MKQRPIRKAFYIALVALLIAAPVPGNDRADKRSARKAKPLKLIGKAVGPTSEMIEAAKRRTGQSDEFRNAVSGTKYRLMSVDHVENGTSTQTAVRLVYYDYTNDRTLLADADLAGKQPITVREGAFQPMSNDDEYAEAVSILEADAGLAADFGSGTLKAYRAMPDVTVLPGSTERLVNIGLLFRNAPERHEVVSVSIKRGAVVRYESKAPPASNAAGGACGIVDANQATTANGTAGQFQLTVLQQPGPTTLWEMLIVRPSASSGTRKSGIEIRDVKYKGKSVLKRGHAPVLNVQYVPRPGEISCGPYRDWQWQEGMFQAPQGATPDQPGFRILDAGQIATSSIESGLDSGNFRGVAIYQQDVGYGPEVVLLSEMEAGWYRYVMEWRFAPNGTIRPRYGFGAVDNSCVCARHHHHVYWRFDLDIVSPTNKIFQYERGRKFLRPITNEISMFRSVGLNRGFVIQNSAGDEAYEIVPGPNDGTAYYTSPESGTTTTFGRNDFWLLRYKNVVGGTPLQNEIDDGFNQTTSQNAFIQIDSFLTNESLVDQDVVVWYGGHFIHDDALNLRGIAPQVLGSHHVVGPDLRAVRW